MLPGRLELAVRAASAAIRRGGAGNTDWRAVQLAPDMRDREAVVESLTDSDAFGNLVTERDSYIGSSIDRVRITLSLLPSLPVGARVLELGSHPYLMTLLLRQRGLDITSANWFGADSGIGNRGNHVVHRLRRGETVTFAFDHFNVECDVFPYPDGWFDAVLFCEILEHLPADPTHALVEIHRVLKPGGTLVLTTPNAVRWQNIYNILSGENVYELLSGYGAYGRHNREYTVPELRRFLAACGYEVVDVFSANTLHTSCGGLPDGLGATVAATDGALTPVRGDRGDNLFAVARVGVHGRRWAYPDWLYQSRHALRRVVAPDVVVGFNDDLQADGLSDYRPSPGVESRWTGPKASVTIGAPGEGTYELTITGAAPPSQAGSEVTLTATADGWSQSFPIHCDGRPFSLSAMVPLRGTTDIALDITPTWRDPATGDRRGVAISAVRCRPASDHPA